jgi:hypothetical protein
MLPVLKNHRIAASVIVLRLKSDEFATLINVDAPSVLSSAAHRARDG